MAPPTIQSIDESDEYLHVRYRDPDEFEEIRTPDWAAEVAESVVEGGEVRMGRDESQDEWRVQSVLVPTPSDTQEAESAASEIVEKIQS
ncbi:hypothetical protein L593_09420 [Salinarchaeum sp. Harcht-Bsk1]|uniref:hypothetical protein n=1 Tax=Salinarchaeum sp. Harcht-Bsk1 TaxID=1333523 RepID=UPI0003422A7E|nr:hypothetical protein [Salinarchaeum sp. Harcht-Bsk1]AGN01829.1 hypothetical protein L593_09420 [Salinarchaeum sp. Harcht-Bsk1]